MIQRVVGIALFCLILASCTGRGVCSQGEGRIVLVENGKASAKIVIVANPRRYTQIAALELQQYIQKVSGAELEIITDDQPGCRDGSRVLVGQSRITEELGVENAGFAEDEYLVETRGETLILMGRDELEYGPLSYEQNGHWPGFNPDACNPVHRDIYKHHSSLWAVYDFLEKQCGVRWYMMTELGEVVPENDTLVFANIHVRRKPWAQLRRFNYGTVTDPWHFQGCAEGARPIFQIKDGKRDLYMWMERMRFGGIEYENNHSMYAFFDRFGTDNLRLYANSNAVYGNQLCYSNPDVIKQIAGDICDYFDGKYPDGRYVDISRAYWLPAGGDFHAVVPMDNHNYCKCPLCAGKWEESFGGSFIGGSLSDYIWGFVNDVAGEVKKSHPDKYVSALAYWQYGDPPSFELEDNVAVMVCKAALSQYGDPDIKAYHAKYMPIWRTKTKHLTTWEYYNFPHFGGPVFPGIQPHRIDEDIKFLKEVGIEGQFIELDSVNPAREHINMYVCMKLLDDPATDIDELLDEYYRLFYGPAEEPMSMFFERLEEIFTNQDYWKEVTKQGKDHLDTYVSWEVMCPPKVLVEFGEIIAAAYKAVGSQEPYLDRVKLMDKAIYGEMKEDSDTYWRARKMRPNVELIDFERAPVINGILDDECWTNAVKTPKLKSMTGGEVEHEAFARIGYDGKCLYVVVECFESVMDSVVAGNEKHDGNVFEEKDSIELFLVPDPDEERYYQIAFNVIGTINDAAAVRGRYRQQDWESNIELAIEKSHDRWIAEFAIPFSVLGLENAPAGRQWRMNICRNRKISDDRRNDNNFGLYWERSGWAPTFTNWHERRHFAEVTFPDKNRK